MKLKGWDTRCINVASFCICLFGYYFNTDKNLADLFLGICAFFIILGNNALMNKIRDKLGKKPLPEDGGEE